MTSKSFRRVSFKVRDLLELELHLDVVACALAVDIDLASQLHGHGAHEDALAVRVRHRQQVVLAPGQETHLKNNFIENNWFGPFRLLLLH